MTTEQFTALLAILDQHTLGLAVAAVAASITALAALYALLLARRQIFAAHSGIKATFLVELDARWEGTEMRGVRAKWVTMRSNVKEIVEQHYRNMTEVEKREKTGEECSKYLHDLRIKNPREYNDIMSIIGFFENIGYWIDRKYISAEEVFDLFGEAIREIDRLCWKHIHKRIDESKTEGAGVSNLFKHACNLIDYTRTRYAALQRVGTR